MIVTSKDFIGLTLDILMEVNLICKTVLKHVKSHACWNHGAEDGHGQGKVIAACTGSDCS